MSVKGRLHPVGGGSVKIDTTPVRFNYTGALQQYIVPAGVKKIAVDCVGGTDGGRGGRVQCVLKVKPKQVLYVVVAQALATGYNASDIRTNPDDLNSRLIVAGGGGSNGSGAHVNYCGAGGDGGGLVGADGQSKKNSPGGGGGTQTQGGTSNANSGKLGEGGDAYNHGAVGGAGGDGYYGAGSGTTYYYTYMSTKRWYASGGGGGSSYTHPELCSDVIHTQGFNSSSNGWVTITPLKG